MALQLTEKAAGEIKRILQEQNQPEGTMLRVSVAGGGCSGFGYALGFDRAFDQEKDECYDLHDVPVVIDMKSDLYIDGTTIDFHDADGQRGFTFNNPNAMPMCGCSCGG